MNSQMLLGAIGLGGLFLILFLSIRIGQWYYLKTTIRTNSADKKQDSEFTGSSGYRPGGVSWNVAGKEPIPVRRKRFRKGRK